jgi:hypothetical protein
LRHLFSLTICKVMEMNCRGPLFERGFSSKIHK